MVFSIQSLNGGRLLVKMDDSTYVVEGFQIDDGRIDALKSALGGALTGILGEDTVVRLFPLQDDLDEMRTLINSLKTDLV